MAKKRETSMQAGPGTGTTPLPVDAGEHDEGKVEPWDWFAWQLARQPRSRVNVLRRAAGKVMAHVPYAWPAFYAIVPARAPDRDHPAYFTVATLYATNDKNPGRPGEDVGGALRRYKALMQAAPVGVADKAMAALLQARAARPGTTEDGASLARYLYRIVQLLKQAGIGLDWGQLARDLLRWSHPSMYVQQRWARNFYTSRPVTGSEGSGSPASDDTTTDNTTLRG